jgi:LytR cell envelope-related transcriptional attenuator
VDGPLLTPHELIRPWKRATVVASAIAALELAALLVVALFLVAKPLSHELQRHASASAAAAATPPPKQLVRAIHRMHAPAGKARPRGKVKIMVFNGNGLSGAAGAAAGRLQNLGYKISGTANAAHENYATSVVMYRSGFRAEGIRLAHDLGIKVVGPLDGIRAGSLDGGQVAVIVGG